jgi:hypothetical protein
MSCLWYTAQGKEVHVRRTSGIKDYWMSDILHAGVAWKFAISIAINNGVRIDLDDIQLRVQATLGAITF